MSLLSPGNANRLDTLLGGRHQIVKEIYEQFFKKLTDQGATLAFFCDGPVQDDKFDTWTARQNTKYEENCCLFDHINGNATLNDVISDPSINIKQITTFVGTLRKIARQYGTLKTANHHECDAEVAKYATDNNAMAIFTNDTDFLVFEGNWYLWCTEELNVDDCLTMELSRAALTRHLGLSHKQMALFATMAGNDYVKFDRIKLFLASFGQSNDRFLRLADFIRRMDRLPMHLSDSDVANLSCRLFGDKEPENIILIRKSIKSYDLNFEMCHPNDSNELLRRCVEHTTIYTCLADLTMTITLQYFDLREPNFMPYLDLVLPIYRRQYGVLLNHQRPVGGGGGKLTRKFRSKVSHDESVKALDVEPDYPNCKL